MYETLHANDLVPMSETSDVLGKSFCIGRGLEDTKSKSYARTEVGFKPVEQIIEVDGEEEVEVLLTHL